MSIRVTATSASSIGWYANGGLATEPPYSPWSSPGGWRADLWFEVDALGSLSEAGVRNIELRARSPYRDTTMIVHLGDTASPAGISLLGPVESAFTAVTLTEDVKWVATMDSRSGFLRGKLWPLYPIEPANWDIEVPMTPVAEDEVDQIDLTVRLGNVTSEQSVTIHRLEGTLAAADRNLMLGEMIGLADGETKTFYASHKYNPYTLRGLVNGVAVMPRYADPDTTSFTLDNQPTAGMVIRARYVALRTEAPEA